MEDFKGFIRDFIQGRVVELINELDTNEFRYDNLRNAGLKDRLLSTLADEQKAMFGDYSDDKNQYIAKLMDEVYRQGITDGMLILGILKKGNKDD